MVGEGDGARRGLGGRGLGGRGLGAGGAPRSAGMEEPRRSAGVARMASPPALCSASGAALAAAAVPLALRTMGNRAMPVDDCEEEAVFDEDSEEVEGMMMGAGCDLLAEMDDGADACDMPAGAGGGAFGAGGFGASPSPFGADSL